MLEFLALFTIAGIGVAVLAALLFFGFLFKLILRLLLLPFALIGGLLKILLVLGLVVVGLALAPVFLGLLLVIALPVLILLGLFGLGWAVATA